MSKKFRVYATYSVCLYADIEAEDSQDAWEKAIDLDGSNFVECSLGDWTIESDPEEITEEIAA